MSTKFVFLTLLIVAAIAIFTLSFRDKLRPSVQKNKNYDNSAELLEPQYKQMGNVDVEATPLSIKPGNLTTFKLSLNTHSVNLDYDYLQIATLADDKGNEYKPQEWTGSIGGHHLEGDLIFASLPSTVKTITLRIDGIDNKEEVFSWSL